MKIKIAFCVFAGLFLSACGGVPVIKADETAVKGLSSSPLTPAYFEKTDFATMKAGNAMFGAVGAIVAVSQGNALLSENGIDDPAAVLANKLSIAIAQKYGAVPVEPITTAISRGSDDIAQVIAATGVTRGHIVDVQSLNWMTIYFPTNWTHYKMIYSARARIINAQTGSLVAQVPCTYNSDTEETAADWDQLTANQAALLKQKIAVGIDECVKVILDTI